ncbi:oxysterol-binding protein-related protein 1C-like isoform X1 [Zingiber officinale]|uniref:oxysterol-binding protein-related protein 1C-like isoform X1 n=2 Tax=Zingiber officinale TaxID=94328 RepID=UPI001C4B5DDE|nr:oxysterol-binding protein-related protein 1C-like isoform X1 [Zingiber officinale]
MNPFCCASSAPVSPAAAAAAATSLTFPSLPAMPPPPPPLPPPPFTSDVRRREFFPANRSGGLRSPAGTDSDQGRCHRSADLSASHRTSFHDAPLDHREVQLNNIVGDGIVGILHKWVNYGKGWRPRWFVLHDGVLSYYKIHGPDRIDLRQESEKGSKIIGEESARRLARRKKGGSHHPRKPVGEVHLKVSSIRESRSDDKRFSIFSGTKRLHLRAETGDDRVAWVEVLQAMKDMFPRISNGDHMAPVDNVLVSTEKLRKRLQEDGLSETAIQDCEQIMRSEFAALHKQLVLLQQKQALLVDTLRHLETEKVDLENTVVDESQRQSKKKGSAYRSRHEKCSEWSASESDYDNEMYDAAEEDTDDEDNTYFDTRDFLSSGSFKSPESSFQRSDYDSDDQNDYGIGSVSDSSMQYEGLKYSHVTRRKKMPDPVEKEKGVSLWSIIKDNIGKDLTKVCLPVYFNEPLSSLQKCFEDLEYSYLLDQASEWSKKGNGLMRMLNVAAFAVSAYASTDGRSCKPFNPLLGETYEADYPDKRLRFFSEKVSHHPMIVACHCEGKGWKFWGDSNLKSKFWGRSIQLDPVGVLTLEFDDGEVFQWNKVATSIYNLILGKLYCDHYGIMRIQGNREYSCKLKFKEQSIIDRNPHQVQGIVQDRNGRTVATLFGKWDESMHYVNGDCSGKGRGCEPLSEAHLLWKRSRPPSCPTRYNLTRFAITLNELTPGLKEKLPPTDSRLRPDQRCLENGQYEMANAEKLRLEKCQRQARKMQERGWKPRWFAKDKENDTYKYVGGYWEAREEGKWDGCPDIFGQVANDQIDD